jgi:glutamate-1-semialdehyde 2,1-aminomutase
MEGARQAQPISQWPDAAELHAKARRLIAQPPRPIRRDRMAAVLEYFETRCGGSKKATAKAAKRIPGAVQHNLAFNYPFPLNITRAEGAHLWDVDGNRYVDFLQAGGPTVLGSNYAPVREKVVEVLRQCGPVTGLFHEFEYQLAELIHRHMPAVEMFRMVASGTEGCMAAIRAARNFTGKLKVIKVGGAYHGWSDQLVLGTRIPGSGRFEAAGIPESAVAHTQEFYPNDIEGENGLRALLDRNRQAGGTAAVIVEPLGPESGTRPVEREFNATLRELCDEFGALLIFDEVVTAFRLGLGGVQGYLGIRPDLTVFGKCVAGGFPGAGGVGGRADVMSTLAAGIGGGQQKTLVGGTLSANPLSTAAGYFSILEMEKTNAPALAGRAADRLCSGLQTIIDDLELPFFAYNYGSVAHLQTHGVLLVDITDPGFFDQITARKRIAEEMGAGYAAAGIMTLAGSRLYTSMADGDEVIEEALAGFRGVLESVEGVG